MRHVLLRLGLTLRACRWDAERSGEQMDLLAELRDKLEGLQDDPVAEGFKAALRHIEVAERHLTRARTGDADACNDVIYRANQAFEGVLKEAYSVITDSDGGKRSPHEIEQYFTKEKKLPKRVMTLFTNYRHDWRNPSTHDHRLVFRDDECVLAIVSVSAFALVLLDQIVETVNFRRQREKTKTEREILVGELGTVAGAPLIEGVASLLRTFGEAEDTSHLVRTEAELIGRICGFIVGIAPDLRVTPDEELSDGQRVDLVIRRGDDAVVVEVRRGARSTRLLEGGLAQLNRYLSVGKIDGGVLYVAPYDNSLRLVAEPLPRATGREIWLVAPVAMHEIASGNGSAAKAAVAAPEQ